MAKTHKQRAKDIIEELEADFDDAEPELGLLIVELANERSRMSVRLIEAERAFLEAKKVELKAFRIARKAEAEAILSQPVPKA